MRDKNRQTAPGRNGTGAAWLTKPKASPSTNAPPTSNRPETATSYERNETRIIGITVPIIAGIAQEQIAAHPGASWVRLARATGGRVRRRRRGRRHRFADSRTGGCVNHVAIPLHNQPLHHTGNPGPRSPKAFPSTNRPPTGSRPAKASSYETQRYPHPHHPRRQPAPAPRTLGRDAGRRSPREPVDPAALAAAATAATAAAVQAQLTAGVDIINNGEQSRISFSTYVTQRMDGFGGSWTRRGHRDQNEFPSLARPRVVQLMRDVPTCTGPVAYRRPDLAQQECQQLLDAVNRADGQPQDLFMTAASPGIVALTMENRYYPSHQEYVFALADELRKEYEIIAAHGLTLQLDCPDLAMERHVSYQDEPLSAFQELVALHIRAINRALINIPREQVRLHVCWGNSEGPHHYDVPLEAILDILYEANVGALVMEMANPRHAHEHRVYRHNPLPDGDAAGRRRNRTPKTNYVEHPQLIADRLQQARRRRRRRPHPHPGNHRLRFRHLRRLQPRRPRHSMAETPGHARRRRKSPAANCSRRKDAGGIRGRYFPRLAGSPA